MVLYYSSSTFITDLVFHITNPLINNYKHLAGYTSTVFFYIQFMNTIVESLSTVVSLIFVEY